MVVSNWNKNPNYTENRNRNPYKVRKKLKRAQGKARPTLSLLPAVRDGGNYTGHYWVGGGLRGRRVVTARSAQCPPTSMLRMMTRPRQRHRNWVRGGLLLPTSMRMMTIILVMVMWMIVASS